MEGRHVHQGASARITFAVTWARENRGGQRAASPLGDHGRVEYTRAQQTNHFCTYMNIQRASVGALECTGFLLISPAPCVCRARQSQQGVFPCIKKELTSFVADCRSQKTSMFAPPLALVRVLLNTGEQNGKVDARTQGESPTKHCLL